MVSKAALAIPIAVGAAGVSFYAYLMYNRRNKKKDDAAPIKDWTEHRMVLNKAYANLVLSQLDFIRQSSNTLINVLKIHDEDQTFSIVMKGTPESVQKAEFLVNRLIESSPDITTSVMEIPKEKLKLIVGDFGNNLLSISRQTDSRILLKCDPDFYEVSPFYIEIQGPREKNALAHELIKQALGKDPSTAPLPSTNKWDDVPKESSLDIINGSQNSKFLEVTVSFISNINRFYVQLFRLSSALAKMEERLAESMKTCIESSFATKKPEIGTMVAVPYLDQGKWHRAKIVDLNEKNMESRTARAMFVDYGDEEDVKIDKIQALPKEFLQYPYFAVECSLAGVLPKYVNQDGGEGYSDEALDFFESLVSDKPNKILMARKFGTYFVKSIGKSTGRRERSQSIPALTLVDTNSSEDVNIAMELISKGYARALVTESNSREKTCGPDIDESEEGFEFG